MWPEASRIRVFMLVPGVEFPHFCSQCKDPPCVDACPTKALSISEKTGAILVNKELCDGCGDCIEACPGRIPHIHPTEKYAVICDFCGGAPQCVRVCQQGKWNVLNTVPMDGHYVNRRLYARRPEEVTRELATMLYGEQGEKMI